MTRIQYICLKGTDHGVLEGENHTVCGRDIGDLPHRWITDVLGSRPCIACMRVLTGQPEPKPKGPPPRGSRYPNMSREWPK